METKIIKTKKSITDIRIKIKVWIFRVLLVAPFIYAMIMDDPYYLRIYYASSFFTSMLFFNERKYWGYLKTWVNFHILKMHNKPLSIQTYMYYKKRIEILKAKKEAYYEQVLIQDILDTVGSRKDKYFYTGKGKKKFKFKSTRKFENAKRKTYRLTNFNQRGVRAA